MGADFVTRGCQLPDSYGSQLSLARQGLIARGLGNLVGDAGW